MAELLFSFGRPPSFYDCASRLIKHVMAFFLYCLVQGRVSMFMFIYAADKRKGVGNDLSRVIA